MPTNRPISPTRVGILGGGQLARMTAQAASQAGIEIFVLEREEGSPAGQVVGSDHEIVGDWRQETTRRRLAEKVDLVTLENEFIDPAALDWFVRQGKMVYPGPAALRTIQDKLNQKEALAAAGLPVPPFRAVESAREIVEAGRDFGWPLVLKSRRLGYDGHGNVLVSTADGAAAAIDRLAHPSGQRPAMTASGDLYVEANVPFVGELAVMVARGRDGASMVYPVVETIQRDHICHEVVVPARVPFDLARRAQQAASAAVASGTACAVPTTKARGSAAGTA